MLISAYAKFDPDYALWFVQVLDAKEGQSTKWRRHHPNDTHELAARAFKERHEAQSRVDELNRLFYASIQDESDPDRRLSLQLRARKALESQTRLAEEEDLMLAIGKARGMASVETSVPRVRLHDKAEQFREQICERLDQYPYINSILVGESRRWRLTWKLKDGSWSEPVRPSRQGIMGAHRAPIANGFGINEYAHFGKMKAQIRRMLVPQSAQLLILRGVQALLAQALARGKRAAVWGNYVFWYEGKQVGWQVKERSGNADKEDNEAIWTEGDIHSVNFGRIVVLPYIKSDGERVRGHTKNAPHDGPALPRLASEELTIAFEQLDGDLMRDLIGQFQYELSRG